MLCASLFYRYSPRQSLRFGCLRVYASSNSTPPISVPPAISTTTSSTNAADISVPVSQLRWWSLSEVPTAPKILGFAGLLPFVATTLGACSCVPYDIIGYQLLQATYGATILSFTGAAHWGLAMAKFGRLETIPRRYYFSVVPALLAFTTLNLPPDFSLLIQTASFQGLMMADIRAARKGDVPHWYPSLRAWLSVAVSGCLLGTWYVGYKNQSGRTVQQAIAQVEKIRG